MRWSDEGRSPRVRAWSQRVGIRARGGGGAAHPRPPLRLCLGRRVGGNYPSDRAGYALPDAVGGAIMLVDKQPGANEVVESLRNAVRLAGIPDWQKRKS